MTCLQGSKYLRLCKVWGEASALTPHLPTATYRILPCFRSKTNSSQKIYVPLASRYLRLCEVGGMWGYHPPGCLLYTAGSSRGISAWAQPGSCRQGGQPYSYRYTQVPVPKIRWWLIGSAPDFRSRGPGFGSGTSHNDPDTLQDHCVKCRKSLGRERN